jgi:ATP-dependent DNA helicase RecQ
MMLKVLDVDGAVRRVRGGWVSTGEPWDYDADRYDRVRETRRAEQGAMLDYVATAGCRMQFLREALDDPGAERCGRCDNCGGLELAATASNELVEQAQARLDRPGVVVAPRKLWPTGMGGIGVTLSGKIPAEEQAEEGRAIARLTDLGWGRALHDLLRDGAPDGELPVPLRHALVEVLDAWEFPAGRPDGIVVVGSAARPTLLAHLADGLSRYLTVPMLASFDVLDPDAPTPHDVNSAQRLRAVVRRHRLSDPAAVAGRRVLLVDDRTDTGWTLAVCAQVLRRAGAIAAYPMVLASTT